MKNRYCLLIVMMTLFVQTLHAQTCRDYNTRTTPTQDFTLHDDGTVTHHKTGLMWMRCTLGQRWSGAGCTGSGQTYTWQGALQVADSFGFASHSDWRLPDIKELNSIVERACFDPAINNLVFPDTPSTRFWSASPFAGSVRWAWYVLIPYGVFHIGDRADNYSVRLVRGGQ
jgi:hypothetical protein